MMDDEIYAHCKTAALEMVKTFQRNGYEFNARRAIFSHSDTLNLAEEIAKWVEDHMEKSSGPAF
jgi:hypothetical protein